MSEASLIDTQFNPPSVKPEDNEFVLLFMPDNLSKPVVGYYDGYGNWKRLVFHKPGFRWWTHELPEPLGWKPII